MTLNDVVNMIHTDDGHLTAFVFDDESERDLFRSGGQADAYLFSVKSPYVCHFYLNERFSNAEVVAICPVSNDTVDIIIKDGADNG